MENIANFHGSCGWIKVGDFCYRASRLRGASQHYTCGTTGCAAKLIVRNGVPGAPPQQHNHIAETWIPNRNQMYQNVKRRCMSEVTHLLTIYEEEAMRHPDAAPHLLFRTIQPSMRKWRRSVQPAIPHTLQEYGAALAAHPSHGHMAVGTVTAGGACAVILGMPGWRECLRSTRDTIVADGTFQTVPAGLPACQLLTLHVVIEGHYFHPVVALMENRTRELYTAVLRRVWRLADNPRPANVVTDYEPALQAALRDVTGVEEVAGCYFHFLQALVRRARQTGMGVGVRSAGSRLVRLYGALALLPAPRVPAALAELPAAARDLGLHVNRTFHDYFVDFWMFRVRPECFSVYGREHRTSNIAESYHAALKRALGSSPNIWQFTRNK